MWMSVPQMAVFLIRIKTSSGPISGTGASIIQIPGSAFCLARAFMTFPWRLDDGKGFSGFFKSGDGAVEMRAVMHGGHLRADPRHALRHDRIGKGRYID